MGNLSWGELCKGDHECGHQLVAAQYPRPWADLVAVDSGDQSNEDVDAELNSACSAKLNPAEGGAYPGRGGGILRPRVGLIHQNPEAACISMKWEKITTVLAGLL